MNRRLKITFFLLFLLAFLSSYAQNEMNAPMPRPSSKGGAKKVATKEDSIVFKLRSFHLIDNLSRIEEIKIDTSLREFHVYNPVFQNSTSVQYLGNLGTSYQYSDFFKRREPDKDFLFSRNYYDYGIRPDEMIFYDATKPYTLLQYGQWFANKPKGETIMKVFHTQNINKEINFGFNYNSLASQGKYMNQEAKIRNLGFFTGFNYDRYNLWFTIGKNRLENQENGGLPNPEDIKNPDLKPENITVWLTDVKSINNNFFSALSHQFKLGQWKEVKEKDEIFQQFTPRVAIMHIMEFQKTTRLFTEADPNPSFTYSGDKGQVFFYGSGNIPNINKVAGSAEAPATIDRTGQSIMSNLIILKFMEAKDRKYTFGKQAFLGNDIVSLYYPREEMVDTGGVLTSPLGLTQTANYSNTFVGGSIYRTEGKFWNWSATGKSYLQGRNALDYELSGKIDKPIISRRDTSFVVIFARMANRTPDFFYDNFYSNHFKWENHFDKVYSLHIGSHFDKPDWRLKASVNYTIINNFVFFNSKAVPEQASSEFSVVQASLQKNFKFGGLNIQNWLVYQKTTTEKYLKIPSLIIRNCFFYEGVYAKVLYFQFGADTRYETSYNADNYSPATGMFYRQDSLKTGDYAWIDLFANIRLKRTRFYLKYVNMATNFVKGGYFTSPSYPGPFATFLFGLSWSFYN